MQPLTIWTIVQLAVFIIVWVIIFCVGYILMAWLKKRKMKKGLK